MPPTARKLGRPEGVVLDGALLRARRTELGLSQSDVADLAPMGVRTVRTAEQGVPVSPDTAKLLAATLGLAFIEILRPAPDWVHSRLVTHGLAPLPPPPEWVPVEAEPLLRDALSQDGAITVCIEGPSGVGKSTLVRRVVAELAERWPDGAVWVAAGRLSRPEHLAQVRAEIADCLGFAVRLPDPAVVSPEAFDGAFRRHLWRWPRLLVLDDLEDPDLLRRFADPALESKVVVTTHTRWVADNVQGVHLRLEPWAEPRVRSLLVNAVEPHRLDADPVGTSALMQMIGGLPLHAQLAASGLRRTRHQTVTDYTTRVRGALEDVSTWSEGSRARSDEPMVSRLLDRLGGTLPPGALAAIRDLSLIGDAPFAEPFAAAAIGRSPAEVRAMLDALTDAYLLRYVDGGGAVTRFRIDDWALGAWGRTPSIPALQRVMAVGPQLLQNVIENPRHDRAAASLKEHLPAIRRILGLAARRLHAGLEPAPTPADLPSIAEAPPGFDTFPESVMVLTGLIRLAPPKEAGLWVTAAAMVARARGDDAAYGQLAFLLGWWWYLRGEDVDKACAWMHESARVIRDTGPPDLAVALALHAGMLERMKGGMAVAAPYYEATLELAREVGCQPEMMAAVLLSCASSRVFRDASHPDWAGALPLVEDALSRVEGDDNRMIMLGAAATVDLAVTRHMVGGEPVPLEQVDAALCAVIDRLGGDPLMVHSAAALVERLGGAFSRTPVPAKEVFLGMDRHDSEAALQHLLEMAGHFGAGSARRVDDSLHETALGHLASWVIAGFPLGDPPGPAFDLFLPLEPVRDLLAGTGREHALRFVAALRGPEHDAYRAIEELAELA